MQVESLLAEVEALDEKEAGNENEALDGRCRMLERLASEVSRLSFYAAKGQVLPPADFVDLICQDILEEIGTRMPFSREARSQLLVQLLGVVLLCR